MKRGTSEIEKRRADHWIAQESVIDWQAMSPALAATTNAVSSPR